MNPLARHLFATLAFPALLIAAPPDLTIADFEHPDYAGWKADGEAFGAGPARGALPGQMPVDGFEGGGLVNSFFQGDTATGKLTSPELRIERRYLRFLIGGGGFAGSTCLNLVVDGKIVRTATGPNTKPGGSERLELQGWDVTDLAGKTAKLEIVDQSTGGWGHVTVDQIVLTDTKPPIPRIGPTRDLIAEKSRLHFPVKNGGKKHQVQVLAGGAVVRAFEIELAPSEPDWWAPLEITPWKGQKLTVWVDRLPAESLALESILQSDTLPGSGNLYREPLRPQFHFSAQRGWINDPNGLVFYRGEYHLFYQHNPYGSEWGNMHWGHAVSRDLVHWQELGEALYPDAMGTMFSGSAVVDWKNSSGFGKDGQPPLVLFYTADGNPTTQCLAYSTDGRTFIKYDRNPIVKEITRGNRDPKVIWHEPTQRWVQVLYVELPGKKHTVHFFTSPNLRDWTKTSVTEGGTDRDHFLFECPDFFPLTLDGDPKNEKWVLMAANSEYVLGSFDGAAFTPETRKITGHRGRGFYAAQTFSDEPHGRRIQIGWGQMPSKGMPFNQLQLVPCEMKLVTTPDGPRIAWQPVKELAALREKSRTSGAIKLSPGASDPFGGFDAELLEFRCEFTPSADAVLELNLRGLAVSYDAQKAELRVGDITVPAPLREGLQRLTILIDRTSAEVFASDGLTYAPLPFIAKATDRGISMTVKAGSADVLQAEAHALKSAWNAK